MTEFKFKYVVFLILTVFLGFSVYNNCFVVNTGEVAVISTFGKVSRVATEGLNLKVPFIQDKVFLEIREKTYIFGKTDEQNTTLEVSTKDMQSIFLDFTVQASITNAEKLYRAFQMKYEYRFIRPRVKEVVQSIIAKYTIEEFITKRAIISNEIFTDLKDDFSVYGITVTNVSIVNHDFSDEYERAIEQKKVAEQAVERAKAEQEKLSVEANNKVKLAEYALKEKELKAKANLVESNSLTPQILFRMAVEKWDGKLPKFIGSGINPMLNISDDLTF